ncbi:unnamed protein product [Clonostachys rhizophaga]|uniref:Uncharacterized protein n=1 Tax=Clonostachys rhizophaga TaxID=160324 RepID=A0A9N9YNK1_9HYPO|nr:unnamed protein product [Clonostachys rhizophaga]
MATRRSVVARKKNAKENKQRGLSRLRDATTGHSCFTALPESDLSAYWPYLVYQSREVSLQMVIWTGKFDSSDLSIRPTRGSQLGLVPTTRNYTKMVTHGRIGLFYQDEAGKLIAFENPLRTKIPEGDKDANATDGSWNSMWRNGTENRWETSTPNAFQDIGEWSKIACVTPPMWTNAEEQMRLASASDLTRCFFQRGGRLREVQFDGAAWKAPKEVPLT